MNAMLKLLIYYALLSTAFCVLSLTLPNDWSRGLIIFFVSLMLIPAFAFEFSPLLRRKTPDR